MLTIAILMGGIAAAAMPTASACAAEGNGPVGAAIAKKINYVCSGEGLSDGEATVAFVTNDAGVIVGFVESQADGTVAFVEATFGDQLP